MKTIIYSLYAARVLPLGYEGNENISPLLFVIPFQILCYRLSKDKGIDIFQDKYSGFAKALKCKV